ncbi:polysaccharide/polyol phosphate ABC transporter ATP-binding protein [methanogenic archaeon ISO4-H5]|nr:polysaccharide/polyol phosphate ABC transporter ATP-binding protein [methanogenic archaeon ISO4-H5]
MNPDTAIKLDSISKSFKCISEKHGFHSKKNKFIAIDSVSLEINKGEVVGIIGRNGCGKSTLLSIIAGMMFPDSGKITTNGKIASILELGMGFHPDMSGKENIYLKGELYGFSKKEIDERLEEIIDYSGIKDYIDNPIRTYSSGMVGRLAFSIMTHVDSEIMLIDEVLSIGDSIFVTKAKEHFKKLSTSGKTIVIVSHDLSTIEKICTRVIWMEKGKVMEDGTPKIVCSKYSKYVYENIDIVYELAESGNPEAQYHYHKLLLNDSNRMNRGDNPYYWLELSAKSGYTPAQIDYATYLITKDTTQSELAIEYYKNAADSGNNEAKLRYALLSGKANSSKLFDEKYNEIAKNGSIIDRYNYAKLLLKTSWTLSDRAQAFNAFKNVADEGLPNAMYQVALMYKDGVGTNIDHNLMFDYLEKATTCFFVPAITLLAKLYSEGVLIEIDDKKAFNLYLKAAYLGDKSSQFEVASRYREGLGCEVNKELSERFYTIYYSENIQNEEVYLADKILIGELAGNIQDAINYYISSFNKGNVQAAIKLISLYYSGQLNNKNLLDIILKRLTVIAKSGNSSICYKLGEIYSDDRIYFKDFELSKYWFDKAIDYRDPNSEKIMAERYRDGREVQQDIKKAVELFRDGAKQGNIQCLFSLLPLISNSGPAENQILFEECLKQLERFAENGNAEAAYKLGSIYLDGLGLEKNIVQAVKWFQRGSDLGHVWSKMRLAEVYRDGREVQQDIKKAVELFRDGAKQGNIQCLFSLLPLISNSGPAENQILFEECLKQLERFAENGNAEAAYKLGSIYLDGLGLEKNIVQAVKWFQRGSDLGHVWSKQQLHYIYKK